MTTQVEDDSLSESFLVIESAIRGGSLALFKRSREVAAFSGNTEVSRSEDLLSNIAAMLDAAEIRGRNLKHIVVSRGPGSFTGIRIGLATAFGLSDAFDVDTIGVSVLEAMILKAYPAGRCVAVVPVGRSGVAMQFADLGSAGITNLEDPRSVPYSQFVAEIESIVDLQIVGHTEIFQSMTRELPRHLTAIDLGSNLASVIGLAYIRNELRDFGLEPLYLSNSAFRP